MNPKIEGLAGIVLELLPIIFDKRQAMAYFDFCDAVAPFIKNNPAEYTTADLFSAINYLEECECIKRDNFTLSYRE